MKATSSCRNELCSRNLGAKYVWTHPAAQLVTAYGRMLQWETEIHILSSSISAPASDTCEGPKHTPSRMDADVLCYQSDPGERLHQESGRKTEIDHNISSYKQYIAIVA